MSVQVDWKNFQPDMHYHIQWSATDTLDWESFSTYSAAAECARFLARDGETYTIEQRGEDCPRCASVRAAAASGRT